jgi:hypothetical protein
MNSRYERYNSEENKKTPSRLEKNQNVYESLMEPDFSNTRNYSNIKVLEETPKEINIEKIKNYILSMKEETAKRRVDISVEEPKVELEEPKPKENKVYDINSVLERARQGFGS